MFFAEGASVYYKVILPSSSKYIEAATEEEAKEVALKEFIDELQGEDMFESVIAWECPRGSY